VADEADIADEAIERTLATSLRLVRAAPVLGARGTCLSCEASLGNDARWCDADCRDDWQRAAEAARRNIIVGAED
jgi:hypothetical protein